MKNSMKAVILFICFSIIDLNTSGQGKYLKLTGEKSDFPNILGGIIGGLIERKDAGLIIEKKVPEGTNVKIKSTAEEHKIIRGKLEIVNDSVIAMNGDSILVNNIEKIWVKNTSTYIIGGVLTAASLASSIYIIYGISEMMPIDSNSTIAFFQVFAIFLGAASVVGGIILTAVGISILANGRSYKTYGRSACSISVAYDKTTLPSSDNLASYQ